MISKQYLDPLFPAENSLSFGAMGALYYAFITGRYANFTANHQTEGSTPLFPFGGILNGASEGPSYSSSALGVIELYMEPNDPRFSSLVLQRYETARNVTLKATDTLWPTSGLGSVE